VDLSHTDRGGRSGRDAAVSRGQQLETVIGFELEHLWDRPANKPVGPTDRNA